MWPISFWMDIGFVGNLNFGRALQLEPSGKENTIEHQDTSPAAWAGIDNLQRAGCDLDPFGSFWIHFPQLFPIHRPSFLFPPHQTWPAQVWFLWHRSALPRGWSGTHWRVVGQRYAGLVPQEWWADWSAGHWRFKRSWGSLPIGAKTPLENHLQILLQRLVTRMFDLGFGGKPPSHWQLLMLRQKGKNGGSAGCEPNGLLKPSCEASHIPELQITLHTSKFGHKAAAKTLFAVVFLSMQFSRVCANTICSN